MEHSDGSLLIQSKNEVLKLWSKRTLQAFAALALLAFVYFVYRRTDWSKGFTPDGVMTLVAGVIAFMAVIIQIRSASKQVQDQMKAQRDAEREEKERQRRAIATAILFEIDSFCVVDLDLAARSLARWDADRNNLPSATHLRTNISEIYKGISPLLGSLNAVSVGAIVRFYSMVGTYEGLWHSYQYSLDMLRIPGNPAVKMDPQKLVDDAKAQLKSICDLIPSLRTLAESVTNSVARDCGVEELIPKGDAKKN